MPPPMLPLSKTTKKPRTRQKKPENLVNDSIVSSSSTESTKRTTRSKIKKEPAEKSVQEITDVTVSEESDNGGKKRAPRLKKTLKPIIVKVEPEDLEEEAEIVEPVKAPTKQMSSKATAKKASIARSEQSVYEDAIAENTEKIVRSILSLKSFYNKSFFLDFFTKSQ